jgi:hypothetical protein
MGLLVLHTFTKGMRYPHSTATHRALWALLAAASAQVCVLDSLLVRV